MISYTSQDYTYRVCEYEKFQDLVPSEKSGMRNLLLNTIRRKQSRAPATDQRGWGSLRRASADLRSEPIVENSRARRDRSARLGFIAPARQLIYRSPHAARANHFAL
ncbi:hypothetical protein ACJJTC_010916 [Scirpophaga incertulas]